MGQAIVHAKVSEASRKMMFLAEKHGIASCRGFKIGVDLLDSVVKRASVDSQSGSFTSTVNSDVSLQSQMLYPGNGGEHSGDIDVL